MHSPELDKIQTLKVRVSAKIDELAGKNGSYLERKIRAEKARKLWKQKYPDRVDGYQKLRAEGAEADSGLSEIAGRLKKDERTRRESEEAVRQTVNSGLSPRDLKLPKENAPADNHALKSVRHLTDTNKIFCLLTGEVGSGKNSACAFAIQRASKDGRVRFEYVPDSAHRGLFGEDKSHTDELKTVPLLVLDDFGVETCTDTFRSVLESPLRYHDKPLLNTVLTTNLSIIDSRGVMERGQQAV